MPDKEFRAIKKYMDIFNSFCSKEIPQKWNALLFVILVITMGVLLFRLNSGTPWVVDDLGQLNGLPALNSIERWIQHETVFYFNWGGRIWGELFTLAFLSVPKHIFNYINTIGYLLFTLLIYLNITGKFKISLSVFIFVNFSVFAFLPGFGQDILWVSGTGNYMWSSLLPLLFLAVWRFYSEQPRTCYGNPLFIFMAFILGIMAGWANENVSIGILGILMIYLWMFKKRDHSYPKFAVTGFIGAILGTALLWLAPGNFVRFAAYSAGKHNTSLFHIFYRMIKNVTQLFDIDATLLLIVIMLILLIYSKSHYKLLAGTFFIGTVLAAIAMGVVDSLQERTFLGCTVFMTISAGILYYDWSGSLAIHKAKVILSMAMIIGVGCFYITGRDGIMDYYRRWNANIQIIQAEKAKGNLDVYVNPITPKNRFCAAYKLDDIKPQRENTHWLNKSIAQYYGLHTIQSVHVDPPQE